MNGGSDPELLASPIHAHKLCRLRMVGRRLRFAPLHRRPGGTGWYGPSARAECDLGGEHTSPDRACSCGFHAVADRSELWRLGWASLATPVLDVQLSGRVIEHTHGYRAEYQDVDRMEIAGRCARCGRDATVLGDHRGWVAPNCARCAGRRRITVDLAAAMLDRPVEIAPPDDERAPATTVRVAGAIQLVPSVVAAGAGVAIAAATSDPVYGNVAGLGAGLWLGFGRIAVLAWLHRARLSPQELDRVLGRITMPALVVSLGGWTVAAGIAAMVGPG